MPSLTELDNLFQVLPELPPPVPRRRTVFTDKPSQALLKITPGSTGSSLMPTFIQCIFPWALKATSSPVAPPQRPNPFAVLKAGKKMVVVAAVDAGTISFFRFGQGAFDDFPMN
jgi:tRNA-splicing endonuclease subunit Sen54